MQLELISPRSLDSKAVKSISKGMIYYVCTGRNAWHSTWVSHYYPGCMHTTLASAKEHAEKLRTRGTVFYIKQLPCLVFRSSGVAVIVTEINSRNPLSEYSADAVTDEVTPSSKKIEGVLDNYIRIGAPLQGVAMSFLPNSRFWRQRPSPKNSVIILSANYESVPIENIKSSGLLSIKSFSNGGNYYLGWSSIESRVKSTAVLGLSRKEKTKNQGPRMV